MLGNMEWKDQKEYFKSFINTYGDSSYIIELNGKNIGFYNYEEKDILDKHKGQDIKIQYFKQNPVGDLYKRLGFIPNGESKFHY